MEEKSMNKLVVEFKHKKRKYEIDKLLDSNDDNFGKYDIFDVTNKEDYVGYISANSNKTEDFLIKEAK